MVFNDINNDVIIIIIIIIINNIKRFDINIEENFTIKQVQNSKYLGVILNKNRYKFEGYYY